MGQIGIGKVNEGQYKDLYYFYLEIQGQPFIFTNSGWLPFMGQFPLGTCLYKTVENAKEEFNRVLDHYEGELGISLRSDVKVKEMLPFICMQCKNKEHFKDQSPCKNCMYHPSNASRKQDCKDHYLSIGGN